MNGKYFAHPTAVIDEGSEIGEGVKIWHFCHIMAGSKIGDRCSLGQNVMVATGVILGNNIKVQNNVSIYEGVICEDDVFLGPSMVFTNILNPRSHIPRNKDYQNTIVKRGATIGANATILCGTTIGEYAFIGAGAVVTRDVPSYALITGNPGKQTGWMSEAGHKLHFNADSVAYCEETDQAYLLENNSVKRIK